ncbi:MAG: vWA domain-containing protein [Candidatus Binatia bacterium]
MQIHDPAILSAVHRFANRRGRGMITNLLAFGRVLKELGLKVTLSQVMDAIRSLELIDIGRKADFHVVLRAHLVSEREALPLFERAFDLFWQNRQGFGTETVEVPQTSSAETKAEETAGNWEDGLAQASREDGEEGNELDMPLPVYSPHETFSKKDFSEMGIEESRAMSRALLLIATKIATQVSRRKKRAAKGEAIDLRSSMRRNVKYGGEIMELVSRSRKIKKNRVVLLCDVSGSMDCYSRFLIQFMYGLQNELWGVETFVFSTSLSRITHLIRTRDIENALEKISATVLGWSGGTNIGHSLRTFNREFAPSLVTHRTVVVIISDGWDRGDVALLEREMQNLKRRCRKIIWLNPLLASDNYEPLCKGMQAALPYLDLFLSVHNLKSLIDLGRTLQRLVA